MMRQLTPGDFFSITVLKLFTDMNGQLCKKYAERIEKMQDCMEEITSFKLHLMFCLPSAEIM